MKNSCLKNLKMSVLHPMSDQLSINHRFKANRLKDNCEKSKTFEMICFMRKKSNSCPCCLAELLMKKEKGQNSFFLSMCTKIAQEVSSLSSVDHPSTLLFFFFFECLGMGRGKNIRHFLEWIGRKDCSEKRSFTQQRGN